MTFKDLEYSFNRAFLYSFSKKKFLFVFPLLIVCSILILFCRALGYSASNWISMSLTFLPILLSAGIVLALGLLLIRIYYHEVKSLKITFKKLFLSSFDLIIATIYLCIPPILLYLFLWIILGIFMLLKEIPALGEFISIVLSFAPFLIILSSVLLVIISVLVLFFITPAVALNSKDHMSIAKKVFFRIKKSIFSNLIYFLVALLPIAIVALILYFSAVLTKINYLEINSSLTSTLKWFFISLPFCFFLTPAIIFFFNFAAESFNNFLKHERESHNEG